MKLYDTLSEKKKALSKPKGRPLRLFVCGPTAYDQAHIGHARTYIVFDTLVRYLRSRGFKIDYLQNITDISDKIIVRAKKLKKKPMELAHQFEEEYKNDMKALGVTAVDKYARASAHLREIRKQITTLIKKGYAYETDSGVYFEIKKFKNYGQLSKQNLGELRPGWRIELDSAKKDPLDFALWKKAPKSSASGEDDYGFASPWGKGQPGWHIEDTAISEKYFGPQYDLHGAAVDLKFPHHESEIAQQESASGKRPFVKHWMHAGFLLVNGAKMSKSKGNFITIKDFLKKYDANVLRLVVLSHHYRSPINYTDTLAKNYQAALEKIDKFLRTLTFQKDTTLSVDRDFQKALDDDFNTPKALAAIFGFLMIASKTKKDKKYLIDKLGVLGIKLELPDSGKLKKAEKILADREERRRQKDFKAADKLRSQIAKLGFVVED